MTDRRWIATIVGNNCTVEPQGARTGSEGDMSITGYVPPLMDNDRRKWFFCKKCNRWQLLEIRTVNNCKYCGNVLLAWMR